MVELFIKAVFNTGLMMTAVIGCVWVACYIIELDRLNNDENEE